MPAYPRKLALRVLSDALQEHEKDSAKAEAFDVGTKLRVVLGVVQELWVRSYRLIDGRVFGDLVHRPRVNEM